jgi:sugar phosphate isomerase/epimerase
MPRAISTLGCPELTLDAAFALARDHGLDGIEIRALEGTVDLPQLFRKRFGTPATVRVQHGRIFAFGTSVRLLAPKPDDLGALAAYLPWAEAMGVPYLRVFDGGETGSEEELAAGREFLRTWRDAHGGVELIVETHDAIAHPAALARFLDAFPDLPVLWDAHHTWRKGGEHPADTWRRLRGHVPHIHVKDSISRPGPRLTYSYVLPGTGEFPMAELRQALAADGYDGVLSLEWERMWHPELLPLDVALRSASERHWW